MVVPVATLDPKKYQDPMNKEIVSPHIADFKNHLKTLGYSQSSQSMLPTCAAEFAEYTANKPIQEITGKDIVSYYEYLSERPNKRRDGGLSSIMIHHHLYAIRLFLSYHEQNGTITENPISGLHFPKPEGKQREVLTIEEVKQLYEVAETYRERAIIGIFYGCGLRRNEAVALNIKDISFSSSMLIVREGKGRKRRVVPINRQVVGDIKEYLYNERLAPNEETALITNKLGKRTRGDTYYKQMRKLVEKAGIQKEISLHCLRHSIATHLLENGMSVEYVRDFLGHKHLDATQIYTRISKKRLATL